MISARSQPVDPAAPGFYHCVSRCVRRAWLCGVDPYISITTEDYLNLIDWSARHTRADKRGSVDATEPPILRKLGPTERQWHQQMIGTDTRYWRAIGTAEIPDRESGCHRSVLVETDWQRPIADATSDGLI